MYISIFFSAIIKKKSLYKEYKMANSKNKKSPIGVIIFILVVVLVIGGIVAYKIATKPEPIPEGAVGNTSGNLNNRGLFCESDGYVYFCNPYDQRKLYKMKNDGTEVERIADVPCEYINVYGDQIYFYQTPGADNQVFGLGGLYGVCSTDIKGKSGMNNIDKCIVNSLCMYGPKLYYQHYDKAEGLTLYEADIKTEDKKLISNQRVMVTTPYNGKFMTYNEDIGYYLSQFNPASGQFELYDQDAKVYNVIIEGGYVYYMDIDDSYRIYRMDLSSYQKEKLTDYTVDLFNVYGNNIFFQRNVNSGEEPAIMKMNLDGSNVQLIEEGNFTNINCTSTYTYYYGYGDAAPIYRVPTNGSTSAEVFMP